MADDFYTWVEVELPSKSAYYGGEIPSVVHIRPMTVKDEQRIASVKPEQIVPLIIKNCTQEEFEGGKLLSGDQLAILLKIRELSYGSNYEYGIACPKCDYEFITSMDFADLKYMWYAEDDGQEPFLLSLPSNGKKVELIFPRIQDEESIAQKRKVFYRNNHSAKPDPTLSNMLKLVVKNVEGMDPVLKNKYLSEGIISMDIRVIQDYLNDKMPRPIVELDYTCPDCKYEFKTDLPIGKDFFRYQPATK